MAKRMQVKFQNKILQHFKLLLLLHTTCYTALDILLQDVARS